MKILYIAPCRTKFPSIVASSIHMMKMCEAYVKLGHEVYLVSSYNGYTEDEILKAYGIRHKFRIKQIKVSKTKVGNISYAMKAVAYAKLHQPDIALGRSVTALSTLCLSGCKTTIDLHGPVWEFNKLDYMLFRRAVKSDNLNKIAVNSQALKDMYIHKDLYGAKDIVVAHNGSDVFHIDTKDNGTKHLFSKDRLNVGYFGSLYSGRGVDLIVQLAKNNEDMDFHIFGGSDVEVDEWKRKILNSLNNIYFHGHIPHGNVAFYRSKCDILLAPYSSSSVNVAGGGGDSSRYMNPIKIVEYMSSGKAIITSNIPVLKEVLGTEGALFADPNKIEEWQNALSHLKSQSNRDKYEAIVIRKFEEGLTWEARANKLL